MLREGVTTLAQQEPQIGIEPMTARRESASGAALPSGGQNGTGSVLRQGVGERRTSRSENGNEVATAVAGKKQPGRPSPFVLDDFGLLRLDRNTVYAQVLLLLSQDPAHPTKAATISTRLADRWGNASVMNALAALKVRGFVEKVGYGLYIRTWGQLPEVSQ